MITFNENELSFNNNGTMTPIPYFANATASSLDARLDVVEATLPTKMDKWDLLWTNASPSSVFVAQTVSLNLSNYKHCLVAFRASAIWDFTSMEFLFRIGSEATTISKINAADSNIISRHLTLNNSYINFSEAYFGTDNNNGVMIPYQIYGIR